MSYEKYVVNEHSYYKTYSNASEAFKDADYASPITYFEDDWSRSMRCLGNKFGAFTVGIAIGLSISLFI